MLEHIKKFQMIYGFAAIVFALGAASTQVMTTSAHAEDLAKLKAERDAAIKEVVKVMDKRFEREANIRRQKEIEDDLIYLDQKETLSSRERIRMQTLELELRETIEALN